MDIQNHYYGHSAVLAVYTGMPRPRHIAGLLQHGWTAVSPVASHFADFPEVGCDPARRRLIVWSHRSRAWSPETEARSTTAVGAPILYLEQLLRQNGWRRSDDLGPVFVPFHGTRLVRVTGAHADLARHVSKVDGPSTVCLHHEDLADPEITAAWSEAGHTLVTAGRRDDPLFLLRIMHLVGNASRVSSNRLSTAILYAAAIGTPAAVWGDPLTFGNQPSAANEELRERWPEFHPADADTPERHRTEPSDRARATALARRELGADHLLDSGTLREVLGWTHRRTSLGPAFDYYAASPVHKAAMVLGLRKRTRASDRALSAGSTNPWLWIRNPFAALPKPLPRALPRPLRTVAPTPILPQACQAKSTSAGEDPA